ncbi:MAG: chemotaxis protein CheW [Cyanophyceae cyanobacterium]
MEGQPYLIFSWHGLRCGMEVSLVQEMFLLPELTSIVEAPQDIVGILNLRSCLVPVMHLDLRLGLQMQECTMNDSIVVLVWEGLQIGIIANSVDSVEAISPAVIELGVDYGRVGAVHPAFVAGIAKLDEEILLLNPEALIRSPEEVEALTDGFDGNTSKRRRNGAVERNGAKADGSATRSLGEGSQAGTLCDFYQRCCPSATLKERAIFHSRAESLKQETETTNAADKQMPLAVIALGSEFYGLDLQLVREFIDVSDITPIPCCPSHVAGNINLRGEIVTLVDVRQALNLPLAKGAEISKAVVIKVDDLVAGLLIDDVFDVEYFPVSEIKAVPTAVAFGGEKFLRGTMTYANTMLSILDLPKMLAEGGLEVDEEP